MESVGQGKAHHMAHGKIHQNHKEQGGPDDPGFHFLQRLGLGVAVLGSRLWAWERSVITGLFHGGNHRLSGLRIGHLRAQGVGQEIDLCICHSRDAAGGFFHPGGAGGAGHAGDVKFYVHDFLPSPAS